MSAIIEKLDNIDENTDFDNWSIEEQRQLLNLYYTICKKETKIFKLIYSYHGCDTWEDIFRDYDRSLQEEKVAGVRVAISFFEEFNDTNKQDDESTDTDT